MENLLGFLIESLVAVLLAATIFYCAVLDRKLKRLRTDETTMRDTITELVSATHAAERSIAALRATVASSEETLAERLGRAQALSHQMADQLGEGEEVIGRIARIAKAARDHSERLDSREEVHRIDAEREASRLDARRKAEREAREEAAAREAERRAAAALAQAEAQSRAQSEAQSGPAATHAAAERFAARVRALSLGAAT